MNACFDHVSLRVTDLDASVRFYEETCGLELVSRRDDGSQAVFRVGDALLVLFCSASNDPVDPESNAGVDHIAFCLAAADYDLVFLRLKAGGHIVRGPVRNSGAHGQGMATYFVDPDGNELEIKCYRS